MPLVPCSTVAPDGTVPVTVDVSNNSAVAGTETVFVFVQYPGSSVANRAGSTYKELKGFKRVPLAANTGARVHHPDSRQGSEVLEQHLEQLGGRSGDREGHRRSERRRRRHSLHQRFGHGLLPVRHIHSDPMTKDANSR